MGKFRKKPIVVDAMYYDGSLETAAEYSAMYASNVWPDFDEDAKFTGKLVINTLEGKMFASPGDWIITGVNGERYPCKGDIFEKTYERVDEVDNVNIK